MPPRLLLLLLLLLLVLLLLLLPPSALARLLLRGYARVVAPGALLESRQVEILHADVARCLRKQQRAEFAKVTNLWVCA